MEKKRDERECEWVMVVGAAGILQRMTQKREIISSSYVDKNALLI